MINIQKFSKSALILLPLLTISLFPKDVNAANLTRQQYRIWCEQTKGGKVMTKVQGNAVTEVCQVDGKTIPGSGVPFNILNDIAKDYCLCDSNGNGVPDKGDELKDQHKNVIAQNINPFLDLQNPVSPIDDSVLASLDQASQSLFTNTEFNIWVAITLNGSGNLEMAVDLTDVPTLDQDSTFANTGFTEMNLVYLDAMGSTSGITLASLIQGDKTFVEFAPTVFEPFGEFSVWQLGVTVYNPTTEQSVLTFKDKVIPEPSAMIGLFAVGGLGFASKLKKKSS